MFPPQKTAHPSLIWAVPLVGPALALLRSGVETATVYNEADFAFCGWCPLRRTLLFFLPAYAREGM